MVANVYNGLASDQWSLAHTDEAQSQPTNEAAISQTVSYWEGHVSPAFWATARNRELHFRGKNRGIDADTLRAEDYTHSKRHDAQQERYLHKRRDRIR